jgi:hypothetical protein
VNVLFGEAEVQNIYDMSILANTHEKVVRFDISVQDALLVQSLKSIDHLVS